MTGNRVGDTFTVRISGGLPKSDRPVCLSGIWVGDTFTVIYTGRPKSDHPVFLTGNRVGDTFTVIYTRGTQERPNRMFNRLSGW